MPEGRRAGFALLELVIAAFVFAVGILALEATAASSLRRMHRASQLTLAASLARSRLEMLSAARCADLRSGSDTVRAVVSSWTIEESSAAGTRTISQTLTYRLDGAQRSDVYRSMIACAE